MEDIKYRERIEWLNYWIEDANKDKKRILLIGDSVTREMRKKLNFYLNDLYAVDLLAMSYSIIDEVLFKEIKHFFEISKYEYEYIFYQLGGHHGYWISCNTSRNDEICYINKTRKIIQYLKKCTTNLITMSITLEREHDVEGINLTNHNDELKKRNEIIGKVSEKENVIFYDLNEKMDYQKIRYSDWCHFYEECYEYITRLILIDFFPDVIEYDANKVETLDELNEILVKYRKIYVYGNGVRGKKLKEYMLKKGYAYEGCIVSEEYMEQGGNVLCLRQADNHNSLVIVTPIEMRLWKILSMSGYDYISLNTDIYNSIMSG